MATIIAFFALALVVGSLVEYLAHRYFLHSRLRHWVVRRHKMHHKTYVRYSVASEFMGFFPAAVLFLWIGFVHSIGAGVAFTAGAVVYVLAVAIAHKWSHEAPHRLFWMDPAVHEAHHAGSVRWNFGVVTNIWDRVFGTYCAGPARLCETSGHAHETGGNHE
jgi:sterol desaturase/sphingolipid hydroxylase (fatty acid hydroxylase superfamily)